MVIVFVFALTISNKYLTKGTYGAVDNYIATFNPNGGTVSFTTSSCSPNDSEDSCMAPAPIPSRKNYNFLGWSMSPDCSGVIYVNSLMPAPSTYYACWESIDNAYVEDVCYCNSCVNGKWKSVGLFNTDNKTICESSASRCDGVNAVTTWGYIDSNNRCPSSSVDDISNSNDNNTNSQESGNGTTKKCIEGDVKTCTGTLESQQCLELNALGYTCDGNPHTAITHTCICGSSVVNHESDTINNPSTGTVGIIIAWVVGIAAIIYSVLYFKKSSLIKFD